MTTRLALGGDHRTVEINLFMLRQQETGWVAILHSGTYRALQRHEPTTALNAAGFTGVEWLSPATTSRW